MRHTNALIRTASASKALSRSRDVESGHAELYKKAMNDMLSDRETDYYVCQVCGFVTEDAPKDNCPVCNAVKGKFKVVK